jgi:hypothetical protein
VIFNESQANITAIEFRAGKMPEYHVSQALNSEQNRPQYQMIEDPVLRQPRDDFPLDIAIHTNLSTSHLLRHRSPIELEHTICEMILGVKIWRILHSPNQPIHDVARSSILETYATLDKCQDSGSTQIAYSRWE